MADRTPPPVPPEALAAAATVTGHTIGCMCQRCDDIRAGVAAGRKQAAAEIATRIELACPMLGEPHAGGHCDYQVAASVARQYAEEPNHAD